MNVLRKCCYRTMRENRRRTVAMILGVMLATALITGTACLLSSWCCSMAESARRENGDYHYAFLMMKSDKLKYISENRNVAEYGIVKHLGWAESRSRGYIRIAAADDTVLSSLELSLTEGRLPETDEEIIVSTLFHYAVGEKLYIGDRITLSLGNRVLGDQVLEEDSPVQEGECLEPGAEKIYTIVGVTDSGQIHDWIRPESDTVITRLTGEEMPGTADVYVKYTDWGLAHQAQVTSGILGVSEELFQKGHEYWRRKWSERCTPEELEELTKTAKYVFRNDDFLFWKRWEFLDVFGFEGVFVLCSAIAVVFWIIMIASVFCIRGSFEISLTEKMKLCGRLASVGTTKRQMRKIVYYEVGAISAIGIPPGILTGHLICWILIQSVNIFFGEAMDFRLYFGTSLWAILFAAGISLATIYYSACRSVQKSSRISPMQAIRQNEDIKIVRKGMKCPGWVKKCFGIGGSIAYKNLKRAKAKYRSTVVSVATSVALFIGLGAFIVIPSQMWKNYQKQWEALGVDLRGEDAYENAKTIVGMEGVEEYSLVRCGLLYVKAGQIAYTEEGRRKAWIFAEEDLEEKKCLYIRSVGESAYQEYCKRIGADPEQAKDKVIVLAYTEEEEKDAKGRDVLVKKDLVQYHPGDVITGKPGGGEYSNIELSREEREQKLEEQEPLSVEVYCQAYETDTYLGNYGKDDVTLLVSDEWMNRHAEEIGAEGSAYVSMHFKRVKTAKNMEEEIEKLRLKQCSIYNYAAQRQSEIAPFTVASIILYLMVAVITLIGVTNIFNVVTTNMEQRAPEFAMLRSVGMTEKEFRRMIWLEGFFYGGQALCFGVSFGLVFSWMLQMTAEMFARVEDLKFHFPFLEILIAAAAVFALLYGIMRYSMNRINRRNIIETIRNENI